MLNIGGSVGEEMLAGMALFIFVFLATASAEEQRTCYKCKVKNQCQELDPTSVEKCRPDVTHCVKKTTVSKATGVSVTERYCGGRDFLDIGDNLIENKCYTDIMRSRTTATICYCSTDYCNSGRPIATPVVTMVLLCITVLAVLTS